MNLRYALAILLTWYFIFCEKMIVNTIRGRKKKEYILAKGDKFDPDHIVFVGPKL